MNLGFVFHLSPEVVFSVFSLQRDFSVPGGGDWPGERLGPHQVCGVDTRRPRGQTSHRSG